MRVSDFRAWMDEHNLTQEGAAQALGLSRRMIAYYLSGEKSIPKTVMLATEGWARRVEA
jgi:transcriptional regulator with XRE-family HTH domain